MILSPSRLHLDLSSIHIHSLLCVFGATGSITFFCVRVFLTSGCGEFRHYFDTGTKTAVLNDCTLIRSDVCISLKGAKSTSGLR